MPPTPSQRMVISEFIKITGAQERVASRLLKSCGWKLDQACDAYFSPSSGLANTGTKEREALATLFDQYRSKTDEPDVMGIDGMMSWLQDIEVDLESAAIMIPLEAVQAPSLGEITKEGFINGWMSVGGESIEKQKAITAERVAALSSDRDLFKRVYRHTFISQKEKNQKALPLANAVVYWQMLFSPPGLELTAGGVDWLDIWLKFLDAKWTKSVNKDMWNQTYEFFNKTLDDPTLGFWSEDGAWPGVIDEFVLYSREKFGGQAMETD